MIDRLIVEIARWVVLLRHPYTAYWYWMQDVRWRIPHPTLPRNYNEKYYWRKIFDHNPDFTEVSDKIAVRGWLDRYGIEMDAPVIRWTGKDPADIPADLLSRGVAVKANHGSGTNILLQQAPPNRPAFDKRCRRFLDHPHGHKLLEWAYFDIDRQLLVEDLIPDVIAEFKVYTFQDRIERVAIIYDRFGTMAADIWLPDGTGGWVRFEGAAAVSKNIANKPRPALFDDAMEVSRKIGRHFDHMRVDILTDGTRNWFSELTVYNQGGMQPGIGRDEAATINTSWDLNNSWFMRGTQPGLKGIYQRALARLWARRSG